jgi:hypothetical protein
VWPSGGGANVNVESVECDAQGAFLVQALPPGNYNAVAVDRIEMMRFSTDVLARLSPLAKTVRVDRGSTAATNLDLQRWP